MPEQSHEEMVDGMLSPSQKHYAEFADSLKGTGAEAWSAYRQLTEQTSALPGIGRDAASKVAKLRADDSLPRDHRFRLADETRATADVVVSKLNQGAQAAAKALEEALVAGLMPQPHRDAAQRALIRDGLRDRFAGKDVVKAAMDHVGKNAAQDAELVGDFGADLFAGQDQDAAWPAFRIQAIAKLMQQPAGSGTERQIASRRALAEFKQRNIGGRVAAFTQAAKMHLRRDDR